MRSSETKTFLPAGALAALILLTILAAGCAKSSSRSALMDEVEAIDISNRELRLRLYDLHTRVALDIERGADAIIGAADNDTVRRNALLWKINGVATLHQTIFYVDALGGLFDVAVFSKQMDDFFRHGAGRDVFGRWQPLAVETSGRIVDQVREVVLASARLDTFEEAGEVVVSWSEDYPLEDLSFRRQSTVTMWASTVGTESIGSMSAVVSMEESLQDLLDRTTIYARDLPKLATWQAELAAGEYATREDAQAFLAQVRDIEAELEFIAMRFDQFVVRVDSMYAESWRGMSAERTALMADVDVQRLATLAMMKDEAALMREFVQAEREAIMVEVEALRLIADGQARGLIDHLILRLAQLAAALLAAALLVGFVLIRLARRGASPPV